VRCELDWHGLDQPVVVARVGVQSCLMVMGFGFLRQVFGGGDVLAGVFSEF
jgi:hypothetical protein